MYLVGLYIYIYYKMIHGPYTVKSFITVCRIHYFPVSLHNPLLSFSPHYRNCASTMLVTSMLQFIWLRFINCEFFVAFSTFVKDLSVVEGSGRNELAQAIRTLVCTYVLARRPFRITVKKRSLSPLNPFVVFLVKRGKRQFSTLKPATTTSIHI